MIEDKDLAQAIELIAVMATSSETPGVHADDEMDALIMAARRVLEREKL